MGIRSRAQSLAVPGQEKAQAWSWGQLAATPLHTHFVFLVNEAESSSHRGEGSMTTSGSTGHVF